MGTGWGQAWWASTACLALVLCTATARAQGRTCEPWPGEPAPLPTVASRESFLSRWSELRVAELVARAQLAEDGDPLESHRLWRRVLCLDPANPLAWGGLDRTRPLRVYRPVVEWGSPDAELPATADPWDDLAAPVKVARQLPPAPGPRTSTSPLPRDPQAGERAAAGERAVAVERAAAAERAVAVERAAAAERAVAVERAAAAERAAAVERAEAYVAEGESRLQRARFAEALGRAVAAREALARLEAHPEVEPLRARAEVLAATAQVALGDDDGAAESFARALAADPSLQLDPMTTSPKVLRVLDAVRGSGAGGS